MAGTRGKGKRKRTETESENEEEEEASSRKMVKVKEDETMLTQPDFSVSTRDTEVGIIERVTLKNFMCHTMLDVKFGPQVNFVLGRNGSGKSSVLTALVVGLGGKANITNRGSSIKGFIKNGKHSAEVTVQIRNAGPDAFKPELYGKSIHVERKISQEGSSAYKIKSGQGKVVTTKREELTHILEQFNIQVDNPIVILNQDTSRNFLSSKSPHDKYRFFLKATQLEAMKNDYVLANESKEVAHEILKQKQETMPKLEKEVYEWEQKYKALMTLKELKDKVMKLKDELIWAVISERERGLEPKAKELRQEEARTPKFIHKLEESEEAVRLTEEAYKTIQAELEDMRKDAHDLNPQYATVKKAKEEKKKCLRNVTNEVRKEERELRNATQDREQIQERIAEIQNSAKQNYETERVARTQKIDHLKDQQRTLEGQKHTTENEQQQFHQAVLLSKQELHKARAEEQELRQNIDRKQRRVRDLESSRKNKMLRFGSWMPELLSRIEETCRRGRFHQKPKGPIGAHLNLKDVSWAVAVESCMKGLIHSFCCNDHDDERTLSQLMAQVCPKEKKPSIITAKFQPQRYNVSAHMPHTKEWPTVLDVIECEDPVIANCIIDQRGVESILLFKDKEEARRVMQRSPPRNCKEAFTAEGDQLYSHPTFIWYSGTGRPASYIVASVEDDLRNTQTELQSLTAEHQQIRQRVEELGKDVRTNEQEERKTQTRLMRLREQAAKVNMEVGELCSIEDPVPVDIATLEEEVSRLEEQEKELGERKQQQIQEMEGMKLQLEEAEERFKELDSRIRMIAEGTDPIKHQLALAENKIDAAKSHRKHYEQKMKEHKAKMTELQKLQKQYKEELEGEIEKAENISNRVRTRRTPQNLESEIKQIQKQILTEEKIRGSHEEITRRYYDTRSAFIKIQKEVKQLTNFLRSLHEGIEKRKLRFVDFLRAKCKTVQWLFAGHLANQKAAGRCVFKHSSQQLTLDALEKVMVHRQQQYAEFRRMIAMRAKFFFIVMLGTRKYTGKMVFDHRKESLELQVQPTPAAGADGTKDMRSLSGGERSYATVCFILSLWDAMESPFRCMDEFDIFMDMVNRRISMDMMLSVANAQRQRQFIFLTPQDMSHVQVPREIVRIFQMREPEKDQATLPFVAENRAREDEEDEGEAE